MCFLKVWWNLPRNPSGLGIFFVERFLITNSISVIVIDLFRLSAYFWFSLRRLCISRNSTTSFRFSSFEGYIVHSILYMWKLFFHFLFYFSPLFWRDESSLRLSIYLPFQRTSFIDFFSSILWIFNLFSLWSLFFLSFC